ncbi:pyridoxamine 5'-phosphate oxidase family protein [Paenibacillus sp. 1A_MP2]|uniref:pyridoxamine 5'-phosphate oxidase family protein n=1 Tax=Paenibacillus sp. 1A_MP2 TaxID=3457495 RepID=UPI003FCEA4B9
MSEAVTQLTESLLQQFKNETFVLLSTVDVETGGPTSTAISWVYAENASTLRVAIDHRSRLVNNMIENPAITVTIFGEEMVYAVNGRASVRQNPLQDVPFNMCCFDISIEAVRNALFMEPNCPLCLNMSKYMISVLLRN